MKLSAHALSSLAHSFVATPCSKPPMKLLTVAALTTLAFIAREAFSYFSKPPRLSKTLPAEIIHTGRASLEIQQSRYQALPTALAAQLIAVGRASSEVQQSRHNDRQNHALPTALTTQLIDASRAYKVRQSTIAMKAMTTALNEWDTHQRVINEFAQKVEAEESKGDDCDRLITDTYKATAAEIIASEKGMITVPFTHLIDRLTSSDTPDSVKVSIKLYLVRHETRLLKALPRELHPTLYRHATPVTITPWDDSTADYEVDELRFDENNELEPNPFHADTVICSTRLEELYEEPSDPIDEDVEDYFTPRGDFTPFDDYAAALAANRDASGNE